MTQFMGELTLYRPGTAGYEDARQAWNLTVNHRPAWIVVAQTAHDVAEAVRAAAAEGLGVAIQSTGHGTIRPADEGAALIITSALKDITVDPELQRAWVGAGLKWGEVVAHTQNYGLTPLFGSSPTVGVVGYTLGGGMGWFGRKYGLATDSVVRLEVVDAQGDILSVSADEHPDLFWALRGGGGAFGVVTGMEIQLYPVQTVYGGNLLYPIEMAADVYRFYREWIKTLPDEFTSSIVLMNFPPLPQVPEFLRGKSALMVRGAYVGDAAQGAAYIQPWLEWRAPMANMFQTLPVSEMRAISNDPVDPMPSATNGTYLRELSDDAIDTIIRYGLGQGGQPPLVFAEVRHMGGAISRVSADANAYSHRDETLNLVMIGVAPTPEAGQFFQQYTAEFMQALGAARSEAVYANFLDGEEAQRRIREAYTAAKFERLTAIKAQYDPQNRFGYAFQIPVK